MPSHPPAGGPREVDTLALGPSH